MSVNIELEGEGLKYTSEVSIFQAGQIIAFLNNGEAFTGQSSQGSNMVVSLPGTALTGTSTLREILDQSGAKDNPQRITAAGSYIMQREAHDAFTVPELKAVFKKSGETLPQNIGRDLKKAINFGYLDEVVGDKNSYYITDAGLRYLSDGFPASSEKRTPSKSISKRRTSTAPREKVNRELLEKLKTDDKIRELGTYISDRRQAYDAKATNRAAIIAVWLLDNLKWDGVSPADLYTVYNALGEPAGNTNSQLINGKVRDQYFGISEKGKFFLSQKGEDYGRHHSLSITK